MSHEIELVARELEAALTTFTAEGYAEEVGFEVEPDGITAEIYDGEGGITSRYKITFTITEEEK